MAGAYGSVLLRPESELRRPARGDGGGGELSGTNLEFTVGYVANNEFTVRARTILPADR